MKKFVVIFCLFVSCFQGVSKQEDNKQKAPAIIKCGIENVANYLSLLENRNVAVVTNQTGIVREFNDKDSIVNQYHLVDFLLSKGIKLQAIFAPEHGFRGKEDAGANISDGKDVKSGLPVYSLHGKHKKPQAEQLKDIDIVLFDIQDVGVRFYTYLSTLHYVMEACAEQQIPLVVSDRPNPNGHYIDGPVMEEKYFSFLGLHPVPVVYGMTIGEYAQMINGEHWLSDNLQCDLTVIPLQNWKHSTRYTLPIKPSPNLPNALSIDLYPSLCFFEQTNVSVGRGTAFPFQVYGSPFFAKDKFSFQFAPHPTAGAKYPKHSGKTCYGEDLRGETSRSGKLDLQWLLKAYESSKDKTIFFKDRLEYLTGTASLREQVEKGWTAEKIRASWEEKLEHFKKIRKKYLLYPDFE